MSLEVAIREGIRESFKERFKERRGKLEIIADVLLVAREGAKKTQIVYNANLNFKRIENYLPYLEEKGLIESMCREYKTTEKGKEFLRTQNEDIGLLKCLESYAFSVALRHHRYTLQGLYICPFFLFCPYLRS